MNRFLFHLALSTHLPDYCPSALCILVFAKSPPQFPPSR